MKAILSILFGAGVFALVAYAGRLLKEEAERKSSETLIAAGLGVLVAAINYFLSRFSVGTKLAWLAPTSLILMICVYICLMYQWHVNGSNWKEMLPFIGVALLCWPTTMATAIKSADLVSNVTAVTFIKVLPTVLLFGAIGFFIADMFYFRYKQLETGDDDKLCSIISGIVTCVIIAILFFTQVNWNGIMAQASSLDAGNVAVVTTEATEAAEAEAAEENVVEDYNLYGVEEVEDAGETVVPAAWYKFYNLDLQLDVDPRNDFNFGSNPHMDGLTAEDYDRELRSRMAKDVALTAGDIAWIDAIVGTRYLGEFYESCKGDWAKTINATKEAWLADQGAFYQTLNSVFAFMDKASVTLDYQTSGLDDQMYMNSMTADGVPDVIVMTTTDHTGYFLTYHFLIKDQEFQVAYRIDCGFQPTNVQAVMGIVPDNTPRDTRPTIVGTSNPSSDSKPSNDSKPSGDSQPSQPETQPSQPETQPETQPQTEPSKPKKDPSADPVNNGNADKGGGQNKPDDGPGEIQPVDPRTETPTGPQNDNNHGYSEPATVTPPDPPVVEEHKSEPVVTDSNPMTYEPDPVTNNGPADPSIQPTSPEGDGAFTPVD